MNKNDDLINDILRELDNGAPAEPAPDPESEADARSSLSSVFSESIPEEEYPEPAGEASEAYDEYANEAVPVDDASGYYGGYPPPQRTAPRRKKKKRKKKRNRLPGVLILTTFIFAVSIVLSMVIIGFGKDMLGIGKSDDTKLIVVEEGASTEDIAKQLKEAGVIKSPKFFVLFSRMRKNDAMYIPGQHFIRPNMAYETIIQNLTTSEVENKEIVEITFPEGITLWDAAQKLEEEGVCKADDFIFNFNAGGYGLAFEDKLPQGSKLKFYRMEGFLFPDTYQFYKEMDPKLVCQRIYYNFDQKMTPERYAKLDALTKDMQKRGIDFGLDQLITMASIVQKEAATKDTMTLVASVFLNRLRNESPTETFSRLQSDPTKNYANDFIRKHMEAYDKAIIDAYNTYEGIGLPPGAIANPGIEAIDAVLANFKSDNYYFYANIYTGETRFAKTYEEHLKNEEAILADQAQYEAEKAAAEQEANEADGQ